ncbi:Chitin synthase, class 5 [Monascus purpureus]|uniref:Chitin synthase, class 5 n=1 Tax=Monascus purpureus TaxID=5098 RepID=A0A507R7P2_MONPU|nr:Chitin synthase, class 5 [Monascus purpureus]BDD61549.1 60S ribosomal protein L24 [Monascus purpureus]
MLVSLTVGKVDAGVAVLLTHDNRLIEFPSVLLPNNIAPGSIVDITVSRNETAEDASAAAFQALQKRILNTYGIKTPSSPVLRLRNATQTSLVLEWDPIELATASLKSLSLYRNGSKAGSIPRPLETRSTKISGLAIHTEYTFHLVLRTSAGTYQSEKLKCRTHKMTDLSGITVTAGIIHPQQKEALAAALERIGGKLVDTVRIDTTHFVCTEGRGSQWEKAVDMNIPVVRPEWVDACEAEGTLVSVRGYYLNADPKARQFAPSHGQHQQTTSAGSVGTSSSRGRSTSNGPPQQQREPEHPTIEPSPANEKNGQPKPEKGEDASQGESSTHQPTPKYENQEKENERETVPDESHDNTKAAEPAEPDGATTAANGKETEKEKEKAEEEEAPQEMPEEKEEQPFSNGEKNGKQREGESELSDVPL